MDRTSEGEAHIFMVVIGWYVLPNRSQTSENNGFMQNYHLTLFRSHMHNKPALLSSFLHFKESPIWQADGM